MNADQHRFVSLHIAHHHREMHVAVNHVLVSNRAEATVDGGQISFDHAPHQHFLTDAISHELSDADRLQIMCGGKHLELRHARHRPVFVHHLANHTGGIETDSACDLNARFCLSGTYEHAAVLCAQGENMTGASQVLRPGFGIDGNLGRQVKLVATILGEWQTDQAASVPGHEINDLGRDLLGSADQIALILAIFVVDDDDHPAVAYVGNGFLNGRNSHAVILTTKTRRHKVLSFVSSWLCGEITR